MNAVGIDVSKNKSTVAILPFDANILQQELNSSLPS